MIYSIAIWSIQQQCTLFNNNKLNNTKKYMNSNNKHFLKQIYSITHFKIYTKYYLKKKTSDPLKT